MARTDDPRPPEPPEFVRRFAPARRQLVGIALLIALVVASVAGAFGTTVHQATARTDGVALAVEYPVRWRGKATHTIEVVVTNTSGRVEPRVDVAFDRGFFEAYAATRFAPGVAYVTDEALVVALHDVGAGETRLVTTEVVAHAYGARSGTVVASTRSAAASVPLRSFVFP